MGRTEQQAADTTNRPRVIWCIVQTSAYGRWRACQIRETVRTAYTQSLAHMYTVSTDYGDTTHIHAHHTPRTSENI